MMEEEEVTLLLMLHIQEAASEVDKESTMFLGQALAWMEPMQTHTQ
jgi:hypothetical protein